MLTLYIISTKRQEAEKETISVYTLIVIEQNIIHEKKKK